MIVDEDQVRERLLAYILPRKPETAAQNTAMDNAVDAQVAWEEESAAAGLPGGVSSIRNDGVSMTFMNSSAQSGYSRETISPVAWAYLRNAGLIAYALPTAKKP